MFFLLSKTLAYVLTPAAWLLAILGYAVVTKNRTRKHRAVVGSLILFWLFSNNLTVNILTNQWETADRGLPTDTLARVGVVLTGGIIRTEATLRPLRPMLGTQGDRVGQALFLYRRGLIRTIVISGGTGDLPFRNRPRHDEGQQAADFLRLAGVPSADIVLENQSKNTYENALLSARLLRHRFHTRRCVLITSALHLRRAEACFVRQGLQVSGFPAGFVGTDTPFSLTDLLPNEEAWANSYALLREVAGFLTYRLRGYC